MAQHDFNIANATFPSVRSDINSALTAINTTQSGTSRPSSAVAGTIWLDTTSATTPTLKYYDGADDISLATLDHSANTVNWLDSTVSITGLSTTATGTVLTLTDSASTSTVNLIIDNQKEVRFRETTANGTNYIGLSAPASVSADLTFTLPVAPTANNQALVASTAGVMSFTPYTFPASDGTAGQVLKTNGSAVLSFGSSGTPTIDEYTTGTSATYTKPSSANWILVEIWGGGGSGGNAPASGGAGGGGGGAYNYFQTPFSNLVGDVTYTVGAGGASQTVTNTDGNVGGTSQVSFANFGGDGVTKTISAFGGSGGTKGTNSIGGTGGGGGGIFGAGVAEVGGSPTVDAAGIIVTNAFGGTSGEAAGVTGKKAIYGGSGGGGGSAGSGSGGGGDSLYGGAGGGGGADTGSTGGTGGTSTFGGNGGNGGLNGGAPTAGSVPSGGGGGSEAQSSGAGAGGLVRFTYW